MYGFPRHGRRQLAKDKPPMTLTGGANLPKWLILKTNCYAPRLGVVKMAESKDEIKHINHLFYAGLTAFLVNMLIIIGATNKLENRLTRLETKQELIWQEMTGPPMISYLAGREKEKGQ